MWTMDWNVFWLPALALGLVLARRAGRGRGRRGRSRPPTGGVEWDTTDTRMDSMFTFDGSDNLTIITTASFMDRKLSLVEVRAATARILPSETSGEEHHRRFRQRVDKSTWPPRFEDDPAFSLERHVLLGTTLPTELELGEDPDRVFEEEDICAFVQRRMQEKFPRDQPPWKCYLLPHCRRVREEGEEDGASDVASVVVFRIHHIIGDGMALAQAIMHSADEMDDTLQQQQGEEYAERAAALRAYLKAPLSRRSNNGSGSAAASTKPDKPHFSAQAFSLLTRIFWGLLDLPGSLLGNYILSASGGQTLLRCIGPDARLTGRKRVAWSAPVDLDMVKATKNATGYTLNDVVMGALGLALERGLFGEDNERGVAGAQLAPFNRTCPRMFPTVIPVTLRTSVPVGCVNNRVSIVYLRLPRARRGMEPRAISDEDRRYMLREMSAEANRIKSGLEVPAMSWLVPVLTSLPRWIARWVELWTLNRFLVICSNVPGPPAALHLAGCKLERINFWVPAVGSSVGIHVGIFSYNQRIGMTCMVDEIFSEVVDPHTVCAGFVQELNAIAHLHK